MSEGKIKFVSSAEFDKLLEGVKAQHYISTKDPIRKRLDGTTTRCISLAVEGEKYMFVERL